MGLGKRRFGFSFSWKRALGLSGLKARISRKLGVPLSRSGRQQKVGRMLGCSVAFVPLLGALVGIVAWLRA